MTWIKSIWEAFRSTMQWLLRRPVTWIANRFSAAPDQSRVFASLDALYQQIITQQTDKKGTLFTMDPFTQSAIIFSDHHKGNRNGADDFANCEAAYLAALEYYHQQQYYYINLGDSEELWENNIFSVLKHNNATFAAEKKFADRYALCKIYGNHDSFWRFDPLAPVYLKQMYGREVRIFGGIVLRIAHQQQHIDILCTHGHQGDARSDGNWLSAAIVTYIWGPLQAFLDINTNLPSDNADMKTLHNQIMYEWSASHPNLMLITGHTHQPVFNSLTHLERLLVRREHAQANGDTTALAALEAEIPKRRRQFPHVSEAAKKMKPSYFNAGCCCFSNGKITGLEIHEGFIRLVKWEIAEGKPLRTVLEETLLSHVAEQILRLNEPR